MNNMMRKFRYVFGGGALVITVFLAFALTGMEVWAGEPIPDERKLSNPEAADFLTQCILSDDAIDRSTSEGKYACCSKSLGYCVMCPASPTENCTLHPHSISGENPLLQQVIVFDVLAPTSPSSDRADPRTDSLNSFRNLLLRTKDKTDENEGYDSKGK